MPSIKPGDVFYDRLPNGLYEKCVLQATTTETPDRHKAARGGTGEFYRKMAIEELEDESVQEDEMIFELKDGAPFPEIVMLKKLCNCECWTSPEPHEIHGPV